MSTGLKKYSFKLNVGIPRADKSKLRVQKASCESEKQVASLKSKLQ